MTLTELVRDAGIRAAAPGLWQAAAQVATPHLRNMATLGGNLCLDTRCTYYDQNYEWRKAIGFCMKKDGRDLLGGDIQSALPGRVVDGYGANAAGHGCVRPAGVGVGQADGRRLPICTSSTACAI